MIHFDCKGYLGKPEEYGVDGGDCAVREGLMAVFAKPNRIADLVSPEGICVRNPWQKPWNNPWNFTKDQLKPLVAGLFVMGRSDLCELILQAHERRNYWCQNFERDFPGTRKGWFKKVQDFQKLDEPGDNIALKGNPEIKFFDTADPLLPNDVHFLELAAVRKYHHENFGEEIHHFNLSRHIKSDDIEQNQMFSECVVFGTQAEYKKTKDLDAKGRKYWGERNEIEYHEMMMSYLERF